MNYYFYLIPFLITLTVSVHVASYGSFKDAPYENLIPVRILREILFSMIILIFLAIFYPSLFSGEKYYVIFGVILSISRIVTELYKQNFREESQNRFKIPSMVHVLKRIPKNRLVRMLLVLPVLMFLAAGFLISYYIFSWDIDILWKGLMVGGTTGLLVALGGGYKDGFFEGFERRKFFRSPLVAALCGVFLIYKSQNPAVIFLAAMGYERMIVEFYKGFIKSGYVPGKFKAVKPKFPYWFKNRRFIIFPYSLTWLVFLALVILDA